MAVPVGRLRVAKEGLALRVPLVLDGYGSPVGMLCVQIGCRLVQFVTLAGGLELWLDEEALVFLGGDGENSAGLSVEQLDELERLVALSTEVVVSSEALAAHAGGGH